jgi:hypothetical protein
VGPYAQPRKNYEIIFAPGGTPGILVSGHWFLVTKNRFTIFACFFHPCRSKVKSGYLGQIRK